MTKVKEEREKIQQKEIDVNRAFTIAQESIWKVLSNNNRVKILFRLYEEDSTWTILSEYLKINPKSLKEHLDFLITYKLIDKKNNLYSLTNNGINLCELNFVKEFNGILVN